MGSSSRLAAADTAASGAPAPRPLAERIRSEDRATRAEAIEELYALLKGGDASREALDAWFAAAGERDRPLHLRISQATNLMPAAAAPRLIAALSDPSTPVQRRAMEGIVSVGPAANAAIERLFELLLSEEPDVVGPAIVALGAIDREGRLLPRVLAMTKSKDVTERYAAVELFLIVYRDHAAERVNDLEPLLDDPEYAVRMTAVQILELPMRDHPALADAMIRLLRGDPHWIVRYQAASAFGWMARDLDTLPPLAAEALVWALETDPRSDVQFAVVHALGATPKLRRQNQEALERCVARQSGDVQKLCRGMLTAEP